MYVWHRCGLELPNEKERELGILVDDDGRMLNLGFAIRVRTRSRIVHFIEPLDFQACAILRFILLNIRGDLFLLDAIVNWVGA